MKLHTAVWMLFATPALAFVTTGHAGDRALAISADDATIEWGPCPEFFPETCRIGVLHGDPAKPHADIFFRVPGNTDLPAHTHTSAERMVLISGRMSVDYEGQEPVMLEPGTYAWGPPELPHSATCMAGDDCVLFIAFNEPVDAMPVAATARHDMHDDTPVAAADDIGRVDFDADCDASVRADFNRALALMHHMMYEQARGEYAAIAEADPGCAMAHWGVATTLFQPLWGTTPDQAAIERGRVAVARAHETVEDDRERALIEATAAFFKPESNRLWDRLPGWIEGMAAAYEAHREDLDVAALYGLSLLTEAQRADNRKRLHDRAESVLADVWEREPMHPGAVHYTIHATDADGRAENALEIVASYGQIAPNVPHALHMPSHIYVRLGDWPNVIDWNTRSAEVAVGHEVDGALSFHYIHAVDYLVYGHLQRGEDAQALRVRDEAFGKNRHQGNFPGAFHLASIPARLAVERRDWEAAQAIEPRTPGYIAWDNYPWPAAISHFGRGLGAFFSDDLEAARAAEARLAELAEAAESTADRRFQTYIEIDRRILAGWLAHADGNDEKAVELMRSAGKLESSVEKHPVTPGTLYPPNEALGDLYMALERYEDALAAYERSDAVWPGRHNTLAGAMRAAAKAGDEAAAANWRDRLERVAPESQRDSI